MFVLFFSNRFNKNITFNCRYLPSLISILYVCAYLTRIIDPLFSSLSPLLSLVRGLEADRKGRKGKEREKESEREERVSDSRKWAN